MHLRTIHRLKPKALEESMMTPPSQPAFDNLDCISCQTETRHYAVVDTETEDLIGGLCTNCSPEDDWSEVDNTCAFCETEGAYSLNAVSPHPEKEDMSTYQLNTDAQLLCETHLNDIKE